MYKDNFIVCIKSAGRILREDKEEVRLPFGSEYSIYLKNIHSRRAVATVSVDGEDVLDGSRIIIEPNCFVELQGVIENRTVKNKFKFIERIPEVEEFRGVRAEDGLVRVEYWFEQEQKTVPYTLTYTHSDYNIYPWYSTNKVWVSNTCQSTYSSGSLASTNGNFDQSVSVAACNYTHTAGDSATPRGNDAGITVPGSDTYQQFSPGWVNQLETDSHVMVVKLSGYTDEKKVEKPIFTKTKLECKTCGLKSDSGAKFCSRCGSRLL